jgi:ankyrin repeat protein
MVQLNTNDGASSGGTSQQVDERNHLRQHLMSLFESEHDLDDGFLKKFVQKTFIDSVNSGRVRTVTASLKAGADVNERWSSEGVTALCLAARLGRLDVVECLLEANADVNLKTTDKGSTPLMESASAGHLDIVKRLIEAGALFNDARADGATAIELARAGGHEEIAQVLAEAGVHEADEPITANADNIP